MKNTLLIDEISTVTEIFSKLLKKNTEINNIYLISDENVMLKYLTKVFHDLSLKKDNLKFFFVDDNQYNTSTAGKFFYNSEMTSISREEFDIINMENSLVYIVTDCNSASIESRKTILEDIERTARKASFGNNNRIIVTTLLPKIPSYKYEVTHLAEREYNYYLEKDIKDKNENQLYLLDIEKVCRQCVRDVFDNINIIRIDSIFGPEANRMLYCNIEDVINESFSNNKVVITDIDRNLEFTCVYIRAALTSLIYIALLGKKGHVYNVSSYTVSTYKIKQTLYESFNKDLSCESNLSPLKETEHNCLSVIKAKKRKWSSTITFSDAIYRTACYLDNKKYELTKALKVYDGKLNRLKDIEVDLLTEVDRICKKYNIKYFAAGGTLLGSARNGRSIPWDDDMDIGMLREDFEKFRKIAPGELSEKYVYSGPQHDKKCHYFFDKIRLSSTYFSTKYSANFEFNDGVFLDIIVYDKTSNNRFFEKIQIISILGWKRAISIKWLNKARKGVHYRASKILLPFFRIIPFSFFHHRFEKVLTRYSNKKNAKYLIDGMGAHVRYGRFPKEYLEELEYREIDGFKVPVPVHYAEYLSFFYGANFINEPPITKQSATHDFSRLDLGEYVFNNKQESNFRSVDIRGELFELDI